MEKIKVKLHSPMLDKVFFKIGEVAEVVNVEPYILRYWESEFSLKLKKSQNGQRLYQKKDLEKLSLIRTLLYEERYTIAGAKVKLKELSKLKKEDQLQLLYEESEEVQSKTNENAKDKLEKVNTRLRDIKIQLKRLLSEVRSLK